mgnify:CR=1 FL=1
MKREPDFGNLLKVLERKVPDRELAGNEAVPERLMHIPAYRNAGYDYAPILAAPGLSRTRDRRRRRAAR